MSHEAEARYDHHRCTRCGWVLPDTQMRRGTAARHDEWFPSLDAFEHYRATGIRAWLPTTNCESDAA